MPAKEKIGLLMYLLRVKEYDLTVQACACLLRCPNVFNAAYSLLAPSCLGLVVL